MLSGSKAYPDASCNLQMPPTDSCLRATITRGPLIGWWVYSLPLIGQSLTINNGLAPISGKSAVLTGDWPAAGISSLTLSLWDNQLPLSSRTWPNVKHRHRLSSALIGWLGPSLVSDWSMAAVWHCFRDPYSLTWQYSDVRIYNRDSVSVVASS